MYNVLVCDDETDIVSALKIYLSGAGYGVLEAHNGAEALKLMASEEVHLVLLDIMMPGTLNGLEVCRQIKADHATRFTKVVLLTARVQASDKEAGLAAGADDYLMKPFSTLQVLETIYRMEAEA